MGSCVESGIGNRESGIAKRGPARILANEATARSFTAKYAKNANGWLAPSDLCVPRVPCGERKALGSLWRLSVPSGAMTPEPARFNPRPRASARGPRNPRNLHLVLPSLSFATNPLGADGAREYALSCKSVWSEDLTRTDADGALTRAGADRTDVRRGRSRVAHHGIPAPTPSLRNPGIERVTSSGTRSA